MGDLIWVQAIEDGERTCCRGFGERIVTVDEQDFYHWDNGEWVYGWSLKSEGGMNLIISTNFFFCPKDVTERGKKASKGAGTLTSRIWIRAHTCSIIWSWN